MQDGELSPLCGRGGNPSLLPPRRKLMFHTKSLKRNQERNRTTKDPPGPCLDRALIPKLI